MIFGEYSDIVENDTLTNTKISSQTSPDFCTPGIGKYVRSIVKFILNIIKRELL